MVVGCWLGLLKEDMLRVRTRKRGFIKTVGNWLGEVESRLVTGPIPTHHEYFASRLISIYIFIRNGCGY